MADGTDIDQAKKDAQKIIDAAKAEKAKREKAKKAKENSKNHSTNKGNKPKVTHADTSNLPSGQGDTVTKNDQKSDANITGAYRATNPSTNNGAVKRLYIVFSANFWSQIGEVRASYTIGRDDNSISQTDVSQGIQDELLSFTSRVDSQDNVPTFQIQLSGMRDWDNILLPNDYVEIKASIFDENGNYVTMNGNTVKKAKNRLIISGLISSIEKTGSSTGGRIYNIACQGMAKILENIHLGLPSDLEANQGYLIYDIGQESDPANNKLDARGNVDGSGSWDGKVPGGLSARVKKIAPYALKYGAKYHVLPGMIVAQASVESGIGNAIPTKYNWWGLTGDIGHGTVTIGGHSYTKFDSFDEAMKYYASLMGDAEPGKSHWATKHIKGITDYKKAIKVVGGDLSYHGDGRDNSGTYTAGLYSAYHSLNLKRLDNQVNI